MTTTEWDSLKPGDRVLILAGHPWAGYRATVEEIKPFRAKGMRYPYVRIDDGLGVTPGTVGMIVHEAQAEVIK